MARKLFDLSIDGHGFYTIIGQTALGRRWITRVDGEQRGTAYTDDSTCALNIADGAVYAGLRVVVNGQPYGQESRT